MGESGSILLLYYCRHSNKSWFLIMAILCAQNINAVLCSCHLGTLCGFPLGYLVFVSSFNIWFLSLQWNNIYSMSSLCSAALVIFYLILLRKCIKYNILYFNYTANPPKPNCSKSFSCWVEAPNEKKCRRTSQKMWRIFFLWFALVWSLNDRLSCIA